MSTNRWERGAAALAMLSIWTTAKSRDAARSAITTRRFFMRNWSLAKRFMLCSLVVLLIAMGSIGFWVSSQIEDGIVHRTGAATALYVDSLISPSAQDLATSGQLSDASQKHLTWLLTSTSLGEQVLLFKLWDASSRVVYSTTPSLVGQQAPADSNLALALGGTISADLGDSEDLKAQQVNVPLDGVLEIYSPVRAPSGKVIGVAEFYYKAADLRSEISQAERNSWFVVAAGGAFIYLILSLFIRRASNTIASQQRALGQERDLLHRLMDSLPDHVFFKDVESRFVRINRADADSLGLRDPEEAVGKTDADFASSETAAAHVADDRRVMASRKPLRDVSETLVRPDGTVRWLSTTKAPIFDAEGNVTGIVGVSRDVTERHQLEEQLAHQAFHDALTGLPNRMLFANRLEHALDRSGRDADPLAVLFIDLDSFKVINDSLGHGVGDQLLLAVAERLQSCVRVGDTVARLGGDEFIVLLEAADAARAVETAKRIALRLVAPIVLGDRSVVITASVGIACKDSPLDRADELLKRADAAMYSAKQRGRAQFALYDGAMQTRAWARLELESDLRQAIVRGEFRVFYQPIVDLSTGRAAEFEALVRWSHPVRGLVSPGEFLPLAEETGLILPIERWVLAEACRQTRAWQRADPRNAALSVSVNLSPRMVRDPDLVTEVKRVLAETGLEPARLKLEITEGALIHEGESAIETLRRLSALGLRLAIDDFGTGYSSLTHLQRLPIDVLKIDQSFVGRIGQDRESVEIVRLIIGLATTMGLAVVAEGIETDNQRLALRELGADAGQGYLFAHPLSAEDATASLASTLTPEAALA